MQILSIIILAIGGFHFKQLKMTLDEYRISTEKRMKEGEDRFRKVEENLSTLRAEVYRDYASKPDLLRMMATLEGKFAEVTGLIEALHSDNGKKREREAKCL